MSDQNASTDTAPVPTTIEENIPATVATAIIIYATAVVTGVIHWIKGALSLDGRRSIGILLDNETETDDRDRLLLVGVTLTKSLTRRFDEALGDDVIINHETRVAITIRTKDFGADLAAGKGRNGSGLPYYTGQEMVILDVEYM